MKSSYFIGLVAGGSLLTSILQGLTQTAAPNQSKHKKRRVDADLGDLDIGVVFPAELEKFKKTIPLSRREFEQDYCRFEAALEKHSEYVQSQLVLGMVMSILSVNSIKRVSSYVPHGLAYDNILRCENDSLAVIDQEGDCEDLRKPLAGLYFCMKHY